MTEARPTQIRLQPSAARLLESMRDIGYSFESALADIVDNSISAGASCIDIFNDIHGDGMPFLAILDNGRGMDAAGLTDAMQHGSKGPREIRAEDDLGRFGLGLKTASFSQCRRLTVASRVGGDVAARCWDLDYVIHEDDWLLKILNSSEVERLPLVERLVAPGTLVIWQSLDRLDSLGSQPDDALAALNEMFASARAHLALTFHRFLAPDASSPRRPVTLRINGSEVVPADPFAQQGSPSSDAHELEIIRLEGASITVQGYTLPHHQNLSAEQLKSLELGTSLGETQGLYVYRSERLIASGTWLGMARRSELTKLLRVRVDVPNSLDAEWSIDVKKSRMRIPSAVRRRLRPLVERMTEAARRPYTYRGTRQAATTGLSLWERVEQRGSIRYQIRRDHPIIEALQQASGSVANIDAIMLAVESTLPLEALFADIASAPKAIRQQQVDAADMAHLLATYVEALAPGKDTLPRSIAEAILATPVFSGQQAARVALEKLRRIVN